MKSIDENRLVVLNTITGWDIFPLQLDGVAFKVVRLPEYEKRIRQYRKIEPKLELVIREALVHDFKKGSFVEMPGTGGWIKARLKSPSRNMGKRGGFRLIYMFFRVAGHIFLYTVYDHRDVSDLSKEQKKVLKEMAIRFRRILEVGHEK